MANHIYHQIYGDFPKGSKTMKAQNMKAQNQISKSNFEKALNFKLNDQYNDQYKIIGLELVNRFGKEAVEIKLVADDGWITTIRIVNDPTA